jgi:hypothetical protein
MKVSRVLFFLAFCLTAALLADASDRLTSDNSAVVSAMAPSVSAIGMGQTLVPTLAGSSAHARDLNNDGKLDLVSLRTNTHLKSQLVVQLGNGDATFQSPISTPLAHPASSMILGDLNGDGILDAVVQDFDVIYVALGNGDGTFKPEVTSPAVGSIQAFATGDFNGDGKLDVALSVTTEVAILLGNGDGTLQTPIVYAGGSYQNISIALGDFNLDNQLDLAIIDNIDAEIVVFLGNGDGTLQNGVSYPTTADPLSLVVGDFNSDGKPDVVVVEQGKFGASNLSHFLGNGDGTFQPRLDQISIQDSADVLASDFNGDGLLDVAVLGAARDLVQIWFGIGDGSFTSAGYFPDGTLTSSQAFGLNGGDFNSDGKADLAVSHAVGSNYSILLQGTSIVSPTLLGFGTIQIGTSKSLPTTLNNGGTTAFAVTSIKIVGNTTDYQQTNTCGSSLAPGASCSITVTFKPHNATIKSATLNIVDGGIVGTQGVALSGFAK